MLNQLKSLDVDRVSMDELIALSAFGRGMEDQYAAHAIPVPEWLEDKLKIVEREILAKSRDAIELRLKEIAGQEATLLSAAEKRQKLAEERRRLEKQLSGVSK